MDYRKKLWNGEKTLNMNANVRVPIKGHVRKPLFRKIGLVLELVDKSDLELCFNWAEEYNKKWGIDFLGDELHKTCSDILKDNLFIRVRKGGTVIGLFSLVLMKVAIKGSLLYNRRVFCISNIMFNKDTKEYVDINTCILGQMFKSICDLKDWKDSLFINAEFFNGCNVGKYTNYILFNNSCCVYGGDTDLFTQLFFNFSSVQEVKSGYGYSLVWNNDIAIADSVKIYDECIKEFEPEDKESFASFSGDIDLEDLSYFTSKKYKNVPQITLPVDSLSCNILWSMMIEDKRIEEWKKENGVYFPLVINNKKEVVINHTTYWYLKQNNIKYAECIFENDIEEYDKLHTQLSD